MTGNLIGARIKALREERKLSQDDLARMFGFKDRQTVSAIETGERRVSAEELLLAVEKLGASLDYFTDPFLLVGEGRFSWRQIRRRAGAARQPMSAWPAAGSRRCGRSRRRSARQRPVCARRSGSHKDRSFEEAMAAGERFAAEFELGDVPAARLAEVMEREARHPRADGGCRSTACRAPPAACPSSMPC